MESTTRAKPKILYTGAPSGQDFNTLKDVGEVSVKNDKDGLEHAEVLWVDCATTKPDQYQPLLKTALDGGKTLVLKHPDALAHEALSRIVGSRLEDSGATLMVSRDPRATTSSSHALTVLDAEPPHLDVNSARDDWGKLLETHRARPFLAVGGPGLIPPLGVMHGIQTMTFSHSAVRRIANWPATKDKSQTLQFGFTSSFHVYRENGGSTADYVVIRVQQATSSPGSLMVNTNNAKGLWQFALRAECSHDRENAHLLGTSPATTNGPSIITQLSIPLRVRYLQDGSCLPTHWFATHGPVGRITEGWGLSNESAFLSADSFEPLYSGKAAWRYFLRAPWNSLDDPPGEFERWASTRYEGLPSRVKNLNILAGSTFTVENLAAWRFNASDIATNPQVKFTETLSHDFVAFATPAGSGSLRRQISTASIVSSDKRSITLNLPQITDDGASPCR